jgi:hypothetical protein
VAGLFVAVYVYLTRPPASESGPTVAEASEAQVKQFCARCHAFPPPETFPKFAWKREVQQGYDFYKESGLSLDPPTQAGVLRYYQNRAPENLPLLKPEPSRRPSPVRFQAKGYKLPHQPPSPTVSNVNLVHLFDKRKLDVLACDMRGGWVMALRPYTKPPATVVLGRVAHPAHAELVDLDGDGSKDILVADLGSFQPTDDRLGKVVLLKDQGGGKYTPITLLKGVGRVADVQAADFRHCGKKDLVVAEFGWHKTGSILYLENQTTNWARPKFVKRVLDRRHGAIHVPVADLNGDGRPDFVALISQEHETIVAFLNQGNGHFRKKTIHTAKHPAYGSSGIQLVDLNDDGKIDVLYTNGDTLDSFELKPYHSIQWLENRGKFPFTHHHLTNMYGVHRAVAADFRGVGRKDIVAVSMLPKGTFLRERRELQPDAVILLEQTSPGKFVRHSLQKGTCDHVTCAVGDIFGSGRLDLVVGTFVLGERTPEQHASFTIWKNQGLRRPR